MFIKNSFILLNQHHSIVDGLKTSNTIKNKLRDDPKMVLGAFPISKKRKKTFD